MNEPEDVIFNEISKTQKTNTLCTHLYVKCKNTDFIEVNKQNSEYRKTLGTQVWLMHRGTDG
jgi:hypothetical protein